MNYSRLTRTMILVMLAVAWTPLLLLSAVIGYNFHTAYRDKVYEHLAELVDKHSRAVDDFLYEKLADIRVVAALESLDELKDPERLRELLQILRQRHGNVFVDLGLVDGHGQLVSYAGPYDLRSADYALSDWFLEARHRDTYISNVFLGLRGTPHFIVTTRINAQDSAPNIPLDNAPDTFPESGYLLRSTIDFEAFNSFVEDIQLGTTGMAFIMNRRGELQTSLRGSAGEEMPALVQLAVDSPEADAGQNSGELLRTPLGDFIPVSLPMEDVAVRAFLYVPDQGREIIYMTTPLKSGAWTLFLRQEESDALRLLYRARSLSMSVLLVGMAGVLLGSWYMARRMVGRISLADREKEIMTEQIIKAGKLTALGELAAGVAHEINNPVAIMVEEAGWVEDIFEDGPEAVSTEQGEILRALGQIKSQGARCREITHKLLSFARQSDAVSAGVQINDLIREVLPLTEKRARYAHIEMQTDLEPFLPELPASPAELQQVLFNLVNNALDAMEKDGGSLKVSTRDGNDEVILEVADTGPGIAKANQHRIFDPFFTTKPVGKGTGLGLSICYGIVRKLGGEITVDSAPGEGATFTVHLPLHPDAGRVARTRAAGKTEELRA